MKIPKNRTKVTELGPIIDKVKFLGPLTKILRTRDDGFLVGLGSEKFTVETYGLLMTSEFSIVFSKFVVTIDHILDVTN